MSQKKIAIIPARSGSKGLPNKNILMLLDKPLIAYTIEAAIESAYFERVIVSTDSLEYKTIAEQYGAEVLLRSAELASDTASSYMVIEDIIQKVSVFDYFVLLQPTSPFRNAKHIQQAVELFEEAESANFLVSVTESGKRSDLVKPIDSDLSLKYFDSDFSNYHRQNKKEYIPNGAIFIGRKKEFLNKKHFFGMDSIAYFMSKADSVDIDDKLDFEFAISIQISKNKKRMLLDVIHNRISEKKSIMNEAKPITLIGHSIFDYWDINEINSQSVNNLGVAGINTQEYFEFILESNLITTLGEKIILFAGINDIVIDGWNPEFTLKWIEAAIKKIKTINPESEIYCISTPPVRGRMDRSNQVINQLNTHLKNGVKKISNVVWIDLSSKFYDPFGNLPAEFTYDGLHFSEVAYIQLQQELEKVL